VAADPGRLVARSKRMRLVLQRQVDRSRENGRSDLPSGGPVCSGKEESGHRISPSLPGQGFPGKIEMDAPGFERRDAHDSIDSRQGVLGGRRLKDNRDFALPIAEYNIG
jgi:hypothetical protein